MENDCKLTCKESTLYGYEKKIRLYLKPELGGYRVSSIDKKILQIFITDLYNDGFSINTIISIKGLLTKSFNYALENHYNSNSAYKIVWSGIYSFLRMVSWVSLLLCHLWN